ncbi:MULTISPECIES: GntR family transcriptional regulator [Aeribacillus]|jgi:DNA-binding GntR family transcriptional regulator|uniref:GntR family transcriptional regulator n=1 Tax=Aeribacillus TaxID=1055323 RepID=UPI000E356877|nr:MULTISPECIES: GntR family transcriptional regulator [Aeribacillus]MED1438431.1 GntR family transcriptional regulator [Aeribacillus composti]
MGQFSISKPLYQQAYDEIKKLILTGLIPPGAKVIASQLAEKYNISRTPLREALRQLQNEGLLIDDQTGIYVIELNRKEFEDLCECRLLLEKKLMEMIVNKISNEQLAQIEKVLAEAENSLKEDDSLKILSLNAQYHKLLMDCCPNRRLVQLLEQVRSLMLIYRANINKKLDPEIINEHKKIFFALKERNMEKVLELIELHLKNDRIRGMKVLEEYEK